VIRLVEEWVQQFLQVPSKPEPPAGGEGTLKIFRAARGFFHYRIVTWILRQVSVFFGVIVGIVMFNGLDGEARTLFLGMEILALVLAVAYLPISFLLVSLDFNYRWYMVTDRSLRIREGILKVQERTMTFSNIQNVAIRQGPLQRLFGIADVEVRTAGGGDGGSSGKQDDPFAESMHIGYFRGVDNAEEIRDLMMNHLRRLSASGLGDPEEASSERLVSPASTPPASHAPPALPSTAVPPVSGPPATPASTAAVSASSQAVLTAAQELLLEVRALRSEAVGGVGG
jgi:membrane protein YdbS with pleckstrin-like domain